jgi:hypothetical protein
MIEAACRRLLSFFEVNCNSPPREYLGSLNLTPSHQLRILQRRSLSKREIRKSIAGSILIRLAKVNDANGRHDLVFKVVFGGDAAAGRALGVSRMTVWRWRHARSPLPERVSKILLDLLQKRVAEVHQAQTDFRYFLLEPPKAGCKLPRHWSSLPTWSSLG